MFQFIGRDFLSGPNALQTAPSEVKNITRANLFNSIFDHFNVTSDISKYGDKIIPQDWTYETILNANFNGNVSAGNLNYIVSQIDGIKIKRREKGTFNWITLKYIEIVDVNSLVFTFNDFLNGYGIEYEYAFVPVAGDIEGNYIINSILSKFSGVFIGDTEQSFRMMYDVEYSENARRQVVGTFEPLGKKYPVIVSNGVLSYETGSVTATILNDDFENTRQIDRTKIVKKKDKIKDYFTNKKPKILKDWNGNLWLVMITGDVSVNYKENSGMGVPQVTFNWTEIGKPDDQQSLYDAGIINIIE